MKRMTLGKIFIAFIIYLVFVSPVPASDDIQGGRDHPLIPRISDSYIAGYEYSEFGELRLALGPSPGGGRLKDSKTVEGKLTRLLYVAPKKRSTLEIIRNYEAAFNNLGEFEKLFTCAGKSCARYNDFGNRIIYPSERNLRLKTKQHRRFIWAGAPAAFGDLRYLAGRVRHQEGTTYVSLLVANNKTTLTGAKKYGLYDLPIVLLEIVDVKEMETSMEFVSADEMASEIGKEGHIALYGIYFDFDKADLKPESDDSLAEIAKLLGGNPAMKIYVVGHTDNKGSPDYNLNLSMRRAQSVIRALSSRYGVAAGRMHPFGAGLYAPVASNDTENGRAKKPACRIGQTLTNRGKFVVRGFWPKPPIFCTKVGDASTRWIHHYKSEAY